MMIKYSDLAVRGIDVSQYNGVIDWSKITNTDFAAIRVGYGKVTDSKFKVNWASAKGKVTRIAYWYLDYYSNHINNSGVFGISDSEWGKIQAETYWNLVKTDPETICFLDIENSTISEPINSVRQRVLTIAQAFLSRADELSGVINGVYTSIGVIPFFAGTDIVKRPLWVAWYTRTQSIKSVLEAVKSKGWQGECLIWQYASDGDLDGDGTGDGFSMGGASKFLDLNVWLGTLAEWEKFKGNTLIIIDKPVGEEMALFRVKVLISNLVIRSQPNVGSNIVERYARGEYDVFEVSGGYGRIGSGRWISMDSAYVTKVETVENGKDGEVYTDTEKLQLVWEWYVEEHS